ncbi:MAG: hypothetical protein ABSB59_22290 [Streptosporangiaceae bacterium]|jgi:hypothetical protein
MKRIAAMAALVITMLAVPATAAMASTSTGGPGPGQSGAGYGRPGPIVRVACPPVHRKVRTEILYRLHRRLGKPVTVRLTCPYIPAKPVPKLACRPSLLRFDLATGSSTLTEVSGPILAPTQEFSYRGATYTIMSINPGANSFTVFKGGFLFVNKGAAVTGGTGFMICAR